MEVTYKRKRHQIKCDTNMPYFNRGEDGECAQCIPACKSCILKHLGHKTSGGWDEEDNKSMDMFISIAGNKYKF